MKKTGVGLGNALDKYVGSNKVVKVGFFEEATYPSEEGKPTVHVAQVAYWNEYGAKTLVPAHDITVYRSLNEKTGNFNLNGRFTRKAKANFSEVHHVDAYEIDIPSRPFFRKTIRERQTAWVDKLAQLVELYKGDTEKALILLGDMIKGDLYTTITTWTEPKNRPSTIQKKGFDAPLRDTMHMARSIGVEVGEDES